MKPEEASWIACAIDSEGSVTLNFERRQVQVRVYNTNRSFVERFAELVGGTVNINFQNKNRGYLPIYYCNIPGKSKMVEVLEEVMPYLLNKRLKAAQGLTWLKETPKIGRPYSGLLEQLLSLYEMESH